MDWNSDMSQAPKDGTAILLCRALDADGKPISPLGIFCQVAAWWGEEGWVVYCSMVREPRLHFDPTHWMPLPEPPSTPPRDGVD